MPQMLQDKAVHMAYDTRPLLQVEVFPHKMPLSLLI